MQVQDVNVTDLMADPEFRAAVEKHLTRQWEWEQEQFANHLATARCLWRTCRELVEAAEMPGRFREAVLRQGQSRAFDGAEDFEHYNGAEALLPQSVFLDRHREEAIASEVSWREEQRAKAEAARIEVEKRAAVEARREALRDHVTRVGTRTICAFLNSAREECEIILSQLAEEHPKIEPGVTVNVEALRVVVTALKHQPFSFAEDSKG